MQKMILPNIIAIVDDMVELAIEKRQQEQGLQRVEKLISELREAQLDMLSEEPTPAIIIRKDRRSVVQFAYVNKTIEIPNARDLPKQERDGLWITARELERIKTHIRNIVKTVQVKQTVARSRWNTYIQKNSKKVSFPRGLERQSPLLKRRREGNRQLLQSAVARIRDLEAATGRDESTLLARLCQKISARAVNEAIETGASDARIAKKHALPKALPTQQPRRSSPMVLTVTPPSPTNSCSSSPTFPVLPTKNARSNTSASTVPPKALIIATRRRQYLTE